MKTLGVMLLIMGCAMTIIGLAMLVAPKIPWLGHLPGDIHCQGKNTSFHFPLTTCIVVSVVLTIVLNIVMRLFRR